MRLLVHYSGDPELVKICNENGDVHQPATEIFFGDRWRNGDKTTRKTLRDAAKNGNFAIPYGAAIPKLAATLGYTVEETRSRMRIYRERFPRLVSLGRDIANFVRETGFVKTTFGRIIYVPRDLAHKGLNALIQGTAAEIMKRAQVAVYRYLEEVTSGEAGIILSIHDEIIIEWPRDRLKDAKEILGEVARRMVFFPDRFKVPLGVSAELATLDWQHKEKYPL